MALVISPARHLKLRRKWPLRTNSRAHLHLGQDCCSQTVITVGYLDWFKLKA